MNPLFGSMPRSLGGFRIVESIYALRDDGPVKRFPKRKAKTVAHFHRMNKKWLKRYGIKRVPCAYQMAGGIVGEPTIVAHPSIVASLRTQQRY
jgi:hypothetical protein